MPRLPRRSKAASRASRRRKPGPRAVSSAICPTPVTQNDGRCEVVPRLPREIKVDVTKCCVRACVCVFVWLCVVVSCCVLLCVVVCVCVFVCCCVLLLCCCVLLCVCVCVCVGVLLLLCVVFFLHSFSEEKSRAALS